MRYREFELTEDELFELNMSPTNLQKMVKDIDARAGMEFELIIPNANSDEDPEYEPDYDSDEMCRSIDDAVQFFHDGDHNGRRDVERLRESMQNDFWEWLDEKIHQDWQNNGEEFLEEWVPNNVDESEWNPEGLEGEERQEALEEFIANLHADGGSSDAFDEFREENQGNYDESDWLDEEDLDRMSAVESAYNISWPHWAITGNTGEINIEDVADNFRQAIGRPVNYSQNYHGGKRAVNTYVVEPDSSLDPDDSNDAGLEFVSPPLPISELLSDLDKIVNWAERIGAYTNDSTGLHMNVSVPDQKNLDYVKLAIFLGDEYILEQFGREGNTYCKSAMKKIRLQAGSNPDKVAEMMRQFQSGLNQLASKMIHTGSTEKYTSINNRGDWIEFRGPGGNWLDGPADIKRVKNTLLRTVVALDVATKPEAFKQEYYKKLYKTLNPKGDDDSIQYFARYAAGELPQSALKSFIRQVQLKRDVNRGKEKGKMWWKVSNPLRSFASIEVVASTREEAIQKATAPDGYPSWANTIDSVVAEPLRPYKDQSNVPKLNGRPSNPDGNYVIVNAETREPAYRFMASDTNDALGVLRQWITANSGTQWDFKHDPEMRLGQPGDLPAAGASTTASHPEGRGRPHDPTGRYAIVLRNDPAAHGRTGGPAPDYKFRFNLQNLEQQGHGRYVLQAWAARNNVDPADYMIVDTTQYTDVSGENQPVAGSTQDLARQRLASQMPRFEMEDGNWEIYSISSGNGIYRFVANTEEEAVRAFNIWQDAIRAPGLAREGFNLRALQPGQPSQTSYNPQQPPARGSDSLPPGNARWRILDRNDQEVYSFINTTSQSDANQYARNWMINTAPAEIRNRGPFNIVPVT